MKVIKSLSVLLVAAALSLSSASAESCCVKAKVAGKDCSHECCVSARKDKKLCDKCQKDASCCDKAIAKGEACKHDCCVTAAKDKKACEGCNKAKKKA